MSRLKNKVAVITGSAMGIGEGIAQLFAKEGARVVVSDLNIESGQAVCKRLVEEGAQALFVHADVRLEADCRSLIDKSMKLFGQIDILINNAGISPRGNIEDTSIEQWDEIFSTNVRGAFLCTQQAIRYMKALQAGSVINIGSVNAYIGESKLLAYSASKGALMTFTKNTANYLKRYRIRVNQINVGWTLTPTEHRTKLLEGRGEGWVEGAVATRPFGRMLLPQDIAAAALFFASDDTECVTGSVLDLEQYPIGSPIDL